MQRSIKGLHGNLSCKISGKGKDALFCFNGVGVAKWIWNDLIEYFKADYKIVTWDYIGHGLSSHPENPSDIDFHLLVKDALIIAETLKIKNAYLLGHSAGFHVALEFYRRKPKLVKGLISCLGTPGETLETFMDSFLGRLTFDIGYIFNAVLPDMSHWINANLLKNPTTYQIGAALRLVNPAIQGAEDVHKYLNHFLKMDFTIFNQLVVTETMHSTKGFLSKVKVPTLLIASEFDKFVPLKISKKMHKDIKNSELFIIKNGTHAALLEQPDIFNLKIEKFLTSLC